MRILTVKTQDSGYLVNGSISVPGDSGNRHHQLVQEWLAGGNTPDPEFSQEELAAQQVSEEQQWVQAELAAADIEINKHGDAHGRTVGTQVAWRNYRNQLRDRVQAGVMSGGERPMRPA